jgi:tetratricopeptide (TPR) repeat protein
MTAMIEILLQAERALSVGLLDQAERLYRQAAASDPRNSIAVVGLARVTLERDDALGAYLLARRALGIDPENEAARRLAVRLEEVLRTRGEPVTDPMPGTSAGGDAASAAGTHADPGTQVEGSDPSTVSDGPRRRRGLLGRLLRR